MTEPHAAPVVSVIMPVFNTSDYLAQAIESVLSQTLADFELVIVDDGSTDDSMAIAARYVRTDRRVRVIRNPNKGLSRARNQGVEAARGDFMAALDSDDVALPDRLSLQVAFLVRHPECVVLGGQVDLVDPEGSPIAPMSVCLHHDDIMTQLLQGRGSAIVQPSAMFRRSAVLAAGGYDERLDTAEDLDLYLRLAERGVLANLPHTLLRMRRHPDSLTAGYDTLKARSVKSEVIRRAYRRRGWDERQVAVREYYQPRSRPDLYVTWVAAAIGAGNFNTAWKYLGRLLRETWRHPATGAFRMCDVGCRIGRLCLSRAKSWCRWRRGERGHCDVRLGVNNRCQLTRQRAGSAGASYLPAGRPAE